MSQDVVGSSDKPAQTRTTRSAKKGVQEIVVEECSQAVARVNQINQYDRKPRLLTSLKGPRSCAAFKSSRGAIVRGPVVSSLLASQGRTMG